MSDMLSKIIIYKGPSMNPTFKDADILEIIPYDGKKIKCGDVITFMPLDGEFSITHRVIAVSKEGVRTLGDNNTYIDEGYIQPKNVIGCVVNARRDNKKIRVYNGMMGRIYAIIIRSVRRVRMRLHPLRMLVRFIYLLLCRSGLFRKCIPSETEFKVFSFSRPNGTELQLYWGRRMVGFLAPGSDRWHIKVPFRLFIDVASLPQYKKEESMISEK
jgi:signal peptidase I